MKQSNLLSSYHPIVIGGKWIARMGLIVLMIYLFDNKENIKWIPHYIWWFGTIFFISGIFLSVREPIAYYILRRVQRTLLFGIFASLGLGILFKIIGYISSFFFIFAGIIFVLRFVVLFFEYNFEKLTTQ